MYSVYLSILFVCAYHDPFIFSFVFFYVALPSQCRRCHAGLEKPYCTRCKAFALICVVCNIAVKGMIDNYYNHNYVMFAKKDQMTVLITKQTLPKHISVTKTAVILLSKTLRSSKQLFWSPKHILVTKVVV